MKQRLKRRLDGKKKLVSLTSQMEADIRAFCREKGVESESELIRQAISKYIYPDYDDGTLVLRGIKDTQKKLAELSDMTDLAFKYMRRMHINLISYHPEIENEMAGAAFKSANARHERFFDAFQKSLKDDPPFFERLLHRFYTEDADEQN